MTAMTESTPKPRRKRRRVIVFLGISTALVFTAAYIFGDANRYTDQIESLLQQRTGLTFEIGHMEWGLIPRLHASIDEAVVSGDNWTAEIRDVKAEGEASSLFGRRVNISGIHADTVVIQLPDDPRRWLDVYRDVREGLRPRKRPGEGRFRAESIGPITVDRAELHSDDFADVLLAAKVSISDVMATSIDISIEGASPAGGPGSSASAEATIERNPGHGLTSFTTRGAVSGVDLHSLLPEFPPAIANATFKSTSNDPKKIGVAIEGDLTEASQAALNGRLTAMFWYTPEHVSVSEIRYDAPGALLVADLTRHRGGELAANVERAELRSEALDAFLEQTRRDSVYLTAAEDAHVSVEEVLFGVRADGTQEFTQGTLDFSGLAVRDATGHAYETGLSGRGVMLGRQITVENVEGSHSRLSGTLEPDFETATIKYFATGNVRLTQQALPPRVSERFIPELSLPLRLDSVEGSFTRGERPGPTLRFDARVDPGTLRLTVAELDSEIAVDGGTLHFENGLLDIALEAGSPELGDVTASGTYEIKSRRIDGVIECSVPRVLPNFIKGLEADSMYTSILEQFGETGVRVSSTLPKGAYDTVAIAIAHETTPALEGSIEFARIEDGGLRLGDMRVAGTLETATLDSRMKGPFETSGPADIVFERNAKKESFEVRVDGSPASARFGQRIEKRPGDPLLVQVLGKAPRSRWSADRLIVTALGEAVPMKFVEGGLLCEPVTLSLDAMSRLAPEGGFLAGNATIGFDTRSDSLLFGFENASFRLEEDLSLDALDGEVRVEAGQIGESNLRMKNPAGEATLAWARADDGWHGSVDGSYLDVDVLQRILRAIGEASGNEPALTPEGASAGPPEYPLDGVIELSLDRIKYRKALFRKVTGAGVASPSAIRLASIQGEAYGGTIDGSAELLAGTPNMVHTAFSFDGVNMKLLDDLYFEGEREFSGAATGEFMFSAPLGSVSEMLAAGNGSGSISADEGTFGEAGWATRLLSVLKTAEIFAFRSPWKTEGLSYDTCVAEFTMVDGRVVLGETVLTAPAYKMDAGGYMDFGADATDIDVNVNLLQSINRIAEHIPIIRNVAEFTTGRVALRVYVTGPPSDLEFSLPPDAGIIQNVVGIGNREDAN